MRALEREASSLASQSRTLIGEVRKLEVERDLRVEQARQAEDAASAARLELAEVRRKLEALEAQRLEGLPELQAQFVDLYKRGRRGELALLLSANGLREFARATPRGRGPGIPAAAYRQRSRTHPRRPARRA